MTWGATWPSLAKRIEQDSEEYIERLRAVLRIPSVAVRNEGLEECAGFLAKNMTDVGLHVQIIPTPTCPMLFGASDQRADRPTLLLTSHYDVQPPEPLENWTHPPYEAYRDGDRLIARGATDAKGNLVAMLAALEVVRARLGDYPVNVKVLFDGAEEIGSPQLDDFMARHHRSLRADAVLTFDAGFAPDDHPFIWLGSSGMLNVELRTAGGNKDLHSSRSRLAEHSGWALVHALGTIRDSAGRVTIDGFYDHVRPPEPAERSLLERYPWDDSAYLAELGATSLPGGASGARALEKLLFEPSCTITGLASGYAGPGSKEVLPSSAIAKLEFRLVADQTSDDIFRKLQAHLARQGTAKLTLHRLSSTNPTQSPLESPIVHALSYAADQIYQRPVAIKPRHESSGRQAIWLGQELGVPAAISGIGPPNWRGHAPNEFMLIPYFLQGIGYIAATIEAYGQICRKGDDEQTS